MMKILDYYYLTLLRVIVGMFTYKAAPLMALTFFFNLFSLEILLAEHLGYWKFFAWDCGGVCLIIGVFLCIRYSTKRTKRIEEQYKNESQESRKRGATWVICYEIFTVILVIISFATIKPIA